MKIASTAQYRALAFVEACCKSGYKPEPEELELWLAMPSARPARSESLFIKNISAGLLEFAKHFQGEVVEEAESMVESLERLRWLQKDSGRLRLTDLGRALLHDAERTEVVDTEASVVVLSSEDELAYAKLVGQLSRFDSGFLVDPYFRLPQLMTILNSTSISRILVSSRYSGSTQAHAELQIALESPSLPRKLEIRASNDRAMHDRMIAGSDGSVWTLGASLNGVGTVNTVFTPIPEAGAPVMRELAEKLWREAEIIGPVVRDLSETADPNPSDE